MDEMLKCPECGHENLPGAKFCNECGYKFPVTPQPVYCPQCGLENPPGAKFCNECGQPLQKKQDVQQQQQHSSASITQGDPAPTPREDTESKPTVSAPTAHPPQADNVQKSQERTHGFPFIGKKPQVAGAGQVLKDGALWNVGQDGVLYREENGQQLVDAESYFRAQQAQAAKAKAEAAEANVTPDSPVPTVAPAPPQQPVQQQPNNYDYNQVPRQPVPSWTPSNAQAPIPSENYGSGAYPGPQGAQNALRDDVSSSEYDSDDDDDEQSEPQKKISKPRRRKEKIRKNSASDDWDESEPPNAVFSFLSNEKNRAGMDTEHNHSGERYDDERDEEPSRRKARKEKEGRAPKKYDFQEVANIDGYYDDRIPIDGGEFDTGPKKNVLSTVLLIIGVVVVAGILIWVSRYF